MEEGREDDAPRGYRGFAQDYVTPCLVSLAQCVSKDTLWKPLSITYSWQHAIPVEVCVLSHFTPCTNSSSRWVRSSSCCYLNACLSFPSCSRMSRATSQILHPRLFGILRSCLERNLTNICNKLTQFTSTFLASYLPLNEVSKRGCRNLIYGQIFRVR